MHSAMYCSIDSFRRCPKNEAAQKRVNCVISSRFEHFGCFWKHPQNNGCLQQCIYNCFVWADMSATNHILAILRLKSACCYSAGQMCALSVHNKKMILGLLDLFQKIVDVIFKHFCWFKNQMTSTRANWKYYAMSDRKFSRLDHNKNWPLHGQNSHMLWKWNM